MAEEEEDYVKTYEIVEKFLRRNKVKNGWNDLILRSLDLTGKLKRIICQCDEIRNEGKTIRPEENETFKAFSYAEPGDIKVVIIGTAPAATESIANGLAFSSDQYEKSLRPAQAIPKVHEALRRAEILKDGDYHCGHEEWASKGVLLLNAALTITKVIVENADNIKSHCDMWYEFLQELLFEWIIKTPIGNKHKLFVMRWGSVPRHNMVNYAERVWSKVYKHRKLFKKVFNKKICTFPIIDHPTFPSGEGNNFLADAPSHFKKINDKYHDEGLFGLEPKVSVRKLNEKTDKLSLDDKK